MKEPLEQSFDERTKAWAKWGKLDADLMTHAINPHLMGGPRWPAMRESFRTGREGAQTFVASDGLWRPVGRYRA